MAAILHPKLLDTPINTSALIEASTGGPLVPMAGASRIPQRRD